MSSVFPSVTRGSTNSDQKQANVSDSQRTHSCIHDKLDDEISARSAHFSSHIAPVPPQVTAPDSGHSISWFAYNYDSHDHGVPTTNELSLHPRSGAMRKHKQKMCQP